MIREYLAGDLEDEKQIKSFVDRQKLSETRVKEWLSHRREADADTPLAAAESQLLLAAASLSQAGGNVPALPALDGTSPQEVEQLIRAPEANERVHTADNEPSLALPAASSSTGREESPDIPLSLLLKAQASPVAETGVEQDRAGSSTQPATDPETKTVAQKITPQAFTYVKPPSPPPPTTPDAVHLNFNLSPSPATMNGVAGIFFPFPPGQILYRILREPFRLDRPR